MALNKYMHPRNPYKNKKPDFKELAIKFDYFREKVTQNEGGKVILDFKDPSALRALTRALLENDFGIKVTLPLDRLIPTVPQRLNYILWLEDMVGENKPARGIDIGTGASCIYPLLGCRQNGWQFLASEVDDQNIFFAKKNIKVNGMEDKIQVKKVSEDILLLGLLQNSDETYDFSMCNPPFYSDHLEAQGITTSRSADRPEPKSLSTAGDEECVAWGGEVRFVTQMIEESVQLGTKIRVYTSLLGKKNSIHALKDVLQKQKIQRYSTTEFCQGRTMRWGLAWTFDDSVVFPKSTFKEQKKSKVPLEFNIARDAGAVEEYTVPAYTWFLRKRIENLKIHYYTKHSGKFYTCFILQAKSNTWSHQRRKRRERNRQQSGSESNEMVTNINTVESKVEKTSPDNNLGTGNDKIVDSTETLKVCAEEENKDTAEKAECEKGDCVNKQVTEDKEKTYYNEDFDSVEKNVEVKDNVCEMSGSTVVDSEKEKSSRKRSSAEPGPETEVKKMRVDNDNKTKDNGNLVVTELNNEKVTEKTSEQMEKETGASGDNSVGTEIPESNTLDRKKVVEQFWKEMEENKEGQKKKKSSFYETLEPFDETEECLILCKMVLKKEEGEMSLVLTHIAGNKESMHQIMQYFKNILKVKTA